MTGMPAGQRAASRRWLLPQERWFDRFLTHHEANPPLPQQARFQQNYGPDGIVFFAAAGVDILAGAAMGISGALLASITLHGMPAAIGYWLAAAGILSAVLGIIRGLQGSRAGRAFRAGRPFIRPGQPLR
jgi:hypothetical protein